MKFVEQIEVWTVWCQKKASQKALFANAAVAMQKTWQLLL
jgi:hypothetical protein